jgi:hypothetical protein
MLLRLNLPARVRKPGGFPAEHHSVPRDVHHKVLPGPLRLLAVRALAPK